MGPTQIQEVEKQIPLLVVKATTPGMWIQGRLQN